MVLCWLFQTLMGPNRTPVPTQTAARPDPQVEASSRRESAADLPAANQSLPVGASTNFARNQMIKNGVAAQGRLLAAARKSRGQNKQ